MLILAYRYRGAVKTGVVFVTTQYTTSLHFRWSKVTLTVSITAMGVDLRHVSEFYILSVDIECSKGSFGFM